VKDPVFSGKDVAEAVAAAARALAIPVPAVRYVVLDAGNPGGLGVSASSARIAVLLDGSTPPAGGSAGNPDGVDVDADGEDILARIRRVVGAVVEAAGLETTFAFQESEEVLRVVLEGQGRAFFLDDDAEVFQALEHLLQRMFNHEVAPRRLQLDCEGYRDARDAALREQALELAAAVRGDGKPRLTAPLNAYERRIVHITLSDADGVKTYSVGEGADRRVTIAPADLAQG
jgi:spoIIIJ-associated protein